MARDKEKALIGPLEPRATSGVNVPGTAVASVNIGQFRRIRKTPVVGRTPLSGLLPMREGGGHAFTGVQERV